MPPLLDDNRNHIALPLPLLKQLIEVKMNTNLEITPEKVITRAEFRKLTNISRSKEYRLSRKGLLPASFLLDGKVQGYPESDYKQWLKDNTIGRDSI